MTHPDRVLLARFFSKVRFAPAGCWLWTAATSSSGYGVFSDGRAGRSAHRVSYEWLVGPVHRADHIDHLCHNRRCVNPIHLEAVPPLENFRRARRRRTPIPAAADLRAMRRRPTHPGVMFLEEFVNAGPYSVRALAKHMGMSNNRLSEITRQKRSVTAETAVLFAKVTGTSAEFWLNLQLYYDLWEALRTTNTTKIEPLLKTA